MTHPDPEVEIPLAQRGALRGAERRDLGYQANRLARLLRRRLARELAEHGFTAPQAAVVLALAGRDGPVTMSSVAERLGMDRPTLTGITRRLERDGWLTVRPHPSDGRSRLLQLTPPAESALPALGRASARVSGDALHDLNEQEQSQLLDLLERVAGALESDDPGEDRP